MMFSIQGIRPVRLYRFVPGVGIRCSQRGKPSFPPWESDVPPMGIHRFPSWELSGNGKGQWWTGDTPDTHLTCSLALPMVSFCPPDSCLRERGRRADTPYVLNAVLSPSSRQGASPPWDRESAADPLSLNIIDFVARTLFYIGRLPNIGNGRANCLWLYVFKMA